MPAKFIIDLQFASSALESTIEKTASTALIKKWVKSTGAKSGLLTLRFVNLAEGKKLNTSFRKKDYATNVLTFPYEYSQSTLTADIIFCLPVIQKEAKLQEKTLKAHLAHLIIHGCLHAQGYDHENDRDTKKMESLEIKILKTLGFTNPYVRT
jgi:probable rRNA maturation factor